MTITVKQPGKRQATLANVVDALESSETVLGVSLAMAPQGTRRYVKIEEIWRGLDQPTSRVALRLMFERCGFRPVSNRLLCDALAVAKLPLMEGK